MIIPKNVIQNTNKLLLEQAIKYCNTINACEIYNVADLGDGDYRIMYYMESDANRKMKAVLLKKEQI